MRDAGFQPFEVASHHGPHTSILKPNATDFASTLVVKPVDHTADRGRVECASLRVG
jgi:hypothetical protein